MKILVFLAALAVAYPIKYEVGKKYVYEYEGFTLSGVPRSTSMNSGLKVSAKLDISVVDEGRMLLKVRVPEIATFNGTWPTTQFKKSEQLTTKLAPDIEKPIIFEYQNGVVGQIFAPSDLPEPVLNIHRGIINMLHVNLKSTENYFKAQELGIGGICETAYAIVDLEDMVQVVKTKHYDTCIERPVTILNHIRVPYVLTEQQTPNHRAAAVFRYNMTEYGKGLIIQEAMGEEEHVFTLFSEQGGSVETTIRQQLRFVNKASADTIPSIDMANRGDIMFKTPESIVPAKQLTVTKQEITTVLNTIVDNMSFDDISIESPGHWITLLQYLRQAEKQMIMEIWNELSVKLAYRKFLIDTLPIVGTLESIEAIHDIIKANPSIVRENTACLLTGLAFIPRPTLEMINRVEMMIEDPIIAEFTPARRIAMLSFGSLIHNFCHNKTSCPASLIEVLINKYESAPNTTEKEVVLKAMGNAGTVDLVPWIRKLFKKPEQLNVRIQSVAIEALRKIAPMYPTQVRTLLLPILLNPKFDPEVRIISCVILFETKPSVPTVIVIAQQLKIETSNQVASFIFSHINSLANSTAPEKLPTARACKIALRFAKLRPELTARFSKGLHLSMFSQTMNMGGSVDFHIIKHPASFMPRHVHTKVNMNIGGYVVNVLEIGIRAEGIQRLIENMTEPQSMFKKHKNMMDMIKKSRRPPISSEEFETRDELYKYKPTKEQETELLGHLYVRLFGNELYLFELDKTVLLDIVKAGSLGLDFEKIERKLREGLSYNWLKAMPLFEISIFEPSILGLPLHLHLMSSWISTMKTSTSATMIRDPDMHVKPSSSEEESNEHYSSEEHWWQETPPRSHNSGEFEFDMHHRPKPVSRQQRYRESHYMTESLTGIKAEAQFVKNDAIHIQVRMGVDAILVQTGVGIAMKMKSNIPLIGEMNLDLAHQKYFINFDPIKTPRELMVFSSNIFTFTKSPRELYGRISIISPPMKKTVEEPRMMKKEICLEMLKEVAGFEYCADVEYPSVAGYANAPYPPMTGPYWFESRLMPATDQPKSIQFSVENIIPITMQSIKVEIDTIVKLEAIGAQRTTGVEMSVKYNAKTPTKRLDIVLEKISTEEKMVIINFVTDNIIEQGSLEMQIPVKDYDIKTSYETKMKPYPAIKFKSEINKIPDSIVAPLSMWTNFIERYVYYMGVAEVEMEENTPKTIEAIVVLKKPDVIDVEMKIPSCTIIRRGMTLPIPIDVTEISTPTDTMSSLMHKVKKVVKDQMVLLQLYLATCKVMGTHFETFDNVTYQYQLPGDCKHVLTRDGSKLSKFLVLVHRPIDKPTEKIVTAHIEEHKVELLPSMIVKVQDRPIQWREDKYVIPDVLTLVKTPTEILLMANVGIDITYTGEDVITRVNPIFHAKTVGLCGDNNDEKTNELKQPDQTVVTNPTVFAHSWIIAGESCTDACKLTPKFDIREEILNGEDKICFSTVPVKHCIRGCEPRQTVTVSVGFHCMPADYKSADRTERLLRSGEYDMVNLSSKSIDIERHVEAHVACECDACLNLPRDNYYV
ncbi:vitellogenin-like [Glandiceps talaboti]